MRGLFSMMIATEFLGEIKLNVDTFLAISAISALFSGAAVFVLKKWVEHSFTARMSVIESKNRMMAHEYQVRFTRFDEKVTTAIEGAYEIVCRYSDTVRDVIHKAYEDGHEPAKEYLAQADEIAEEFRRFMLRQSIYLPDDIAQKLRDTREGQRLLLSDELARHSKYSQEEGKKTILTGVYKDAEILKKRDAMLEDLQSLVQKHLSQFVLKS